MTREQIEQRVAESYELDSHGRLSVARPMVTVRTSAYNHAEFIVQCIEGVLMQKTDFDFEYIIGEDFSTDGTREIVFEYAKKYPDKIRVITADRNVGSKANGRRCIQASRGKYMALCEGDDFWVDEYKLQKQFDYMESHPDCGVCTTLGIERKHNCTEPDTIKPAQAANTLNRAWFLSGRTGVLTASFFFRLEYFRPEVSFNPKILIGDWALLMSLTENGRSCAVLPFISVVYRQHSGGVWTSRKKDPLFKLNALKTAFEEYLKLAPAEDHVALQNSIKRLSAKAEFVSSNHSRLLRALRLIWSAGGRMYLKELLAKRVK